MSVSIEGKKFSTVILDFDGTFYSTKDGLDEKIWDKARRILIKKLLEKQSRLNVSKNEFEELLNEYIARGRVMGWSDAYVSMDGDEVEFDKVALSVSKAEFLKFDQKLATYLEELMMHIPVFIFTGSNRDVVLDALEVLIGDLYKKFEINLLAADDLGGLRKPQLEAYKGMIETFGLDPGEAVFVDDSLKEVEVATSLGIKTYLLQEQKEDEAEQLIGPHIVIKSIYEFFELINF